MRQADYCFMSCHTEYERWAASARKQIAEQSKKTNEIMVSNLNQSTKAALVLVLDTFKTSFKDMGNDLRQKMTAMETRLDQKIQSQTSRITNSFTTELQQQLQHYNMLNI